MATVVDVVPKIEHWRFTADEYHRMAEVGILNEDDPVELIDGEIVRMSPIGGRHVTCVSDLAQFLFRNLGDDVKVNVESPVRFGEHWEPEPDFAVIRRRDYGDTLPIPEDVLLLIEVADSSLAYDRGVKLRLYARVGIPESWLVNLPEHTVERHSDPADGRYRAVRIFARGETVDSTVVPGLAIRLDDVLG